MNSDDGINWEFVRAGLTVDDCLAGLERLRNLPPIPGEEMLQEGMNQNDIQAAVANAQRVASEVAQALEPLIEAINEFARKMTAVLRRIAEEVAAAVDAFTVKMGWLLATAGLEGWWNLYANYSRRCLRQETGRWRLLRRPSGWLIDRLPDRVVVFLFREVYLRWF